MNIPKGVKILGFFYLLPLIILILKILDCEFSAFHLHFSFLNFTTFFAYLYTPYGPRSLAGLMMLNHFWLFIFLLLFIGGQGLLSLKNWARKLLVFLPIPSIVLYMSISLFILPFVDPKSSLQISGEMSFPMKILLIGMVILVQIINYLAHIWYIVLFYLIGTIYLNLPRIKVVFAQTSLASNRDTNVNSIGKYKLFSHLFTIVLWWYILAPYTKESITSSFIYVFVGLVSCVLIIVFFEMRTIIEKLTKRKQHGVF